MHLLPQWNTGRQAQRGPGIHSRLGRKEQCVYLARLALGNHGMRSQKFREAAALLGTLCRGGLARACTVLGMELIKGMPLLPDRSRGVKLLERGCQRGDKRACGLLPRLPRRSR